MAESESAGAGRVVVDVAGGVFESEEDLDALVGWLFGGLEEAVLASENGVKTV